MKYFIHWHQSKMSSSKKGTLWQVRVYRPEILWCWCWYFVKCCPSNLLLSCSTPPPPRLNTRIQCVRRGRYGVLGLGQINTCRKVPLLVKFFRLRHFALPSMSLIFLRAGVSILPLRSFLGLKNVYLMILLYKIGFSSPQSFSAYLKWKNVLSSTKEDNHAIQHFAKVFSRKIKFSVLENWQMFIGAFTVICSFQPMNMEHLIFLFRFNIHQEILLAVLYKIYTFNLAPIIFYTYSIFALQVWCFWCLIYFCNHIF